jgi:methylenetetrahydrofolate--tRNA-(uracil-5-)-methyltransferase
MSTSSQIPAPIHVIGGGLAGSEAAWQIARSGLRVVLHEMRPQRPTDAHHTDHLAELVCSNSFRSDEPSTNAVGLLHQEMRRMGSLIMTCADAHQVPAGGALAVDRDGFAQAVTAAIEAEPLIEVDRKEIQDVPPSDWARKRASVACKPARGAGATRVPTLAPRAQ